MRRFKDKVVVVTGGNSGIGEGVVKHFSELGANVVIFGRNRDTLEQVNQSIDNQGLIVQGDVKNSEDLKSLYTQTLEHFGKIDTLVANAGVAKRVHIHDVTESQFDEMVDINYRGLFFTVKFALPYMANNASVILISSIAGQLSVASHSVYSSSKAAVTKLAQNFSADLAPEGIRINSISPGYIQTPIFSERLADNPNYLKEREALIPLKRLGTPKDIAHAASFLASEDASYISGVDLVIDGGLCASFLGR